MIDLKNRISLLNIFQLQEIQRAVQSRMNLLAPRIAPTAPAFPASTKGEFRRGDLVEVYSATKGRTVRMRIDRINAKTLGGHEEGSPHLMWRASPGLCRLVGADKVSVPDAAFARAPAPPVTSHVPSAGGGAW